MGAVDVQWGPVAGSPEFLSPTAVVYHARGGRRCLRPVYCPFCGTHFTTVVPEVVPRAPTCVHYRCSPCGGDGKALTLEAPR